MPPNGPAPVVVALLGAESTGKSTLARQLALGLQAWAAGCVVEVPERLRDWCLANGRTPHAHEQASLARLQQQSIEQAIDPLRGTTGGWVVADTTPLQTAAYSGHYFSDQSLDAAAMAWHRNHVSLTMLMGLDLPWQADAHLRDGPSAQVAVDTRLRHLLKAAALPHVTLYGQGATREARAWQALAAYVGDGHPAYTFIKKRAEKADPLSDEAKKNAEFQPLCAHCDNAECEHRLFSRLIAGRHSLAERQPPG